MMSLEQIDSMSRAAARRSRAQGVLPVTISQSVLDRCTSIEHLRGFGVNIPFIGDRTPKGFKKVEVALFVDTSGFGADNESALSFRQSIAKMQEMTRHHGTLAWATVTMGQFQGYLQAYKVKG